MTIEAGNRSCEEIATSVEYQTRIAEEQRLMDERLEQSTNGYSNGHQSSFINPVSLYYQGFELTDSERFVVKLFGNDPAWRINIDGPNSNGSGLKEKTEQ